MSAVLIGCGGAGPTGPTSQPRVAALSASSDGRYCFGEGCTGQTLRVSFLVVVGRGEPAYSVPVTIQVSAGDAPASLETPGQASPGGPTASFAWTVPTAGGPHRVTVCPVRNPAGCARASHP